MPSVCVREPHGLFLADMEALGELLGEWKKVTVFFLLRLCLAPCVESLMLLDRALFLREQGMLSELVSYM